MKPADASSARSWYRPDITGLRSFAIVPVVAFHAGATFLPGGFIGVDVFYVISGFLITTLLVSEAEQTGAIDLRAFWARRVRRLVPALVATIVVTLPVAALLTSVLEWRELAEQAAASALFLANILFWREATDYFNVADGPSPFLHMWSLGVEEQFYLLWPILVVLACRSFRTRLSLRRRIALALTVVFVVSLALSVLTTSLRPDAAFYLIHTRAWEFAGGGLAALLPLGRVRSARGAATGLAVIGLVLLGYGFVSISERDLYPGHLALVPFLATTCLLMSGSCGRSFLTPVLESRAALWFGNVSYSWYLWHWPLIVFSSILAPGDRIASGAAALVSLGVAWLSYRFVEDPVRHSRPLTGSLRATFAAGAAAVTSIVLVAAVLGTAGAQLTRSEPLRSYAAAARTLPATGCEGGHVRTVGRTTTCVLGDPDARTTVAVIGDSHAGHWRAAFDEAARRADLRLIFRWRSSCPSLDVPIGDVRGVQDPECETFRHGTMRLLEEARPEAVLISNAYGYYDRIFGPGGRSLTPDRQREAWRRGLTDQVEQLRDWGIHVGIVLDNPRMTFDPTACLGRLTRTPSECSQTLATAHSLIAELREVTDQVVDDLAIDPALDVDRAICPDGVCRPVDARGIPVYQDQTHLSRSWTMTQVPRVVEVLSAAVKR